MENKADGENQAALDDRKDRKSSLASRIEQVADRAGGIPSLARRSGFSDSGIRKWVQGLAEPSVSKLVRLAEIDGCTIQWLADGQGDPRPSQGAQVQEPPQAYGQQRRGIEAVFIRNAVRMVERRLDQNLDIETKARLIAEMAQDIQDMHDQEWADPVGPQLPR